MVICLGKDSLILLWPRATQGAVAHKTLIEVVLANFLLTTRGDPPRAQLDPVVPWTQPLELPVAASDLADEPLKILAPEAQPFGSWGADSGCAGRACWIATTLCRASWREAGGSLAGSLAIREIHGSLVIREIQRHLRQQLHWAKWAGME